MVNSRSKLNGNSVLGLVTIAFGENSNLCNSSIHRNGCLYGFIFTIVMKYGRNQSRDSMVSEGVKANLVTITDISSIETHFFYVFRKLDFKLASHFNGSISLEPKCKFRFSSGQLN